MTPGEEFAIPPAPPRPATPVPFGVEAETGRVRPPISPMDAADVATDIQEAQDRGNVPPVLAIVPTVHGDDLTRAGWGVIFASDADAAIIAALNSLVAWRKKQVNSNVWFKIYSAKDGVLPNESATSWLSRMGAGLAPVDPRNGVPFHLMIVGSPSRIPFEFQYTLDLQWSVGRLDFDTPAEFAAYAQNVVDYEAAQAVTQTKKAAMWMPANGDLATNLLCNDVGLPFFQKPLGHDQGFALTTFLGATATKENLTAILNSPPALLFTGSHGLQILDLTSPDLRERQGALVCQGWKPGQPVTPDLSFSGADLPDDAKLHGMIHVMFACFGGGCPQTDNYPEGGGPAKQISPNSIVSRLPQRMLANGALAVVGHVDRAWSFSFLSGAAIPQNQLLRSITEAILMGLPVGMAMDFSNGQWGTLAAQLGLLTGPGKPPPADLTNLSVARDDARNYALFGDPAVRLRVGDMV